MCTGSIRGCHPQWINVARSLHPNPSWQYTYIQQFNASPWLQLWHAHCSCALTECIQRCAFPPAYQYAYLLRVCKHCFMYACHTNMVYMTQVACPEYSHAEHNALCTIQWLYTATRSLLFTPSYTYATCNNICMHCMRYTLERFAVDAHCWLHTAYPYIVVETCRCTAWQYMCITL